MNAVAEVPATAPGPARSPAQVPAPQRLRSLDVLRGLTVAFMIIVNTPGSWSHVFAPLLHADWHGFTPTDLVFPTFLFAVGNALAIALPKFAALPAREVLAKVGKRSALIWLLGFLLFLFPFVGASLADARIPGVLQRIGMCFGAAALLLHFAGARAALAFSVLALLGHWLVLALCGDYTLAGNAALKFDLWLLGERHLYHGEGIAFDPEGLLGTLPATVNVIAGYFAGRLLLGGTSGPALARMAAAGVVLVLAGWAWGEVLPINKKLWTSSYVVLAIGLDLLLLASLAYAFEARGWRRGTYFFEVFGKNTLFIYLLSELLVIILVKAHWYDPLAAMLLPLASPKVASLLFALAFMLLCWLVAYAMDKRRIYIKV